MPRALCLSLALWMSSVIAADQTVDDAFLAERNGGQLPKTFEVLITDDAGAPIADVTVTPWALRSSQGHGRWSDSANDGAGMTPQATTTDPQGIAQVRYPFYRDTQEKTRTFSVSITLTHPEFTIDDSVHIDVPLADQGPYAIKMQRAASLMLIPQSESGDVSTTDLHLVSSDPLDYKRYPGMVRHSDRLEFKTLFPGPFRGMLVRLVDGKAIEFSDPIELTLKSGANDAITTSMHPAIQIHGRLSDNVPRPVIAGRVSAIALPRKRPLPNFDWAQWAAVNENGEFVIESFPKSESIQMIALCDHFIADNGIDPDAKPEPSDPLGGLKTAVEIYKHFAGPSLPPSTRPQIFEPGAKQPITIRMSPMVRCDVSVIDLEGQPLSGIFVAASPNVFWWNWGSQIYCDSLMRSEEWLLGIKHDEPWDSDSVRGYGMPFFEHSDEKGLATLYLPQGKHSLGIYDQSGKYQLPIIVGSREQKVTVLNGDAMKVTLRLEPTGVETLGEYDKLAGVVFGCSTREGKQICALPEVREKMDQFASRLRSAENPRDPAVLAEAFAVVANAFDRAGDPTEAAKWRAKADAEKAKLGRP